MSVIKPQIVKNDPQVPNIQLKLDNIYNLQNKINEKIIDNID